MSEDIWKENMSFQDFFNMCRRVAERAERATDSTEAAIELWKRGFARLDAMEKRLDDIEKSTAQPDC